MSIKTQTFFSDGVDERALVLYDDGTVILFDPDINVIPPRGSGKDDLQSKTDELLAQGFNFSDRPDWAVNIPVSPP